MTHPTQEKAEDVVHFASQNTQPGAALDSAKARKAEASTALTAAIQAHSAARAAVDAHHGPIVERLKGELRAAHNAVLDASSAVTPDHEWEGQKVWCNKRKSRGWSGTDIVRVEGVVFTYRPGVDLGRGHKYTHPEIGEGFVRLLKKDGKPGSATVSLRRGDWQLSEATSDSASSSVGTSR